MQFKNYAVATKIWLLLLGVMGLTLVMGFGMTISLSRIAAQERAALADCEHRMRMAVPWRMWRCEVLLSVLVRQGPLRPGDRAGHRWWCLGKYFDSC